jgi:hypothetical protein
MARRGRFLVLLVSAIAPVGCGFDLSLNGAQILCSQTDRCLPGYACSEGHCVPEEDAGAPSPDASPSVDGGR